MQNIALIMAGGSGKRVGMTIPKQFIEVNGKPILVYTLEKFQLHEDINSIVVVCIKGWEKKVWEYASRFHLDKIKAVVTGGESAIQSIQFGCNSVAGEADDILIIHESVRPLVSQQIISDIIKKCKEYGAAMSATPLKEHVFYGGKDVVSGYYPRENAYKSSSPHAYKLSVIKNAFQKSNELGADYQTAYSSTLMIDVGTDIALSSGSELNIKITTKQDIALFKSLIATLNNENNQFGRTKGY